MILICAVFVFWLILRITTMLLMKREDQEIASAICLVITVFFGVIASFLYLFNI